jgi:hypothetical protein
MLEAPRKLLAVLLLLLVSGGCTLTYATKTNENPDCAAVECSAVQRFSGSRPPR